MDLGTVSSNLAAGVYSTPEQVRHVRVASAGARAWHVPEQVHRNVTSAHTQT